jgi:hypothetical protein
MRFRADGLLLSGFAVLGAVVGAATVLQSGAVFFYQANTPEALMWACGAGFEHPQFLSPEMEDFLRYLRVDTFDCGELSDLRQSGPPGYFARLQYYLTWSAALSWRMFGTTQLALLPLASLLVACYASGAYMLSRLYLPIGLAIVAAVFLSLSPVAISQIFSLRDFSKAPFFVWTIVLMVLGARAVHLPLSLAWATASGIVAGLGYGFRSDLALLLPIGMLFLAIGARLRGSLRAVPVGVFAVAFTVTATPIMTLSNSGSAGMLVAQGTTEPFRAFLGLSPSVYSLGHAYSDELTLSAIAAAEIPRHPDWDANEGRRVYGVSQAISLSTANLLEWAPSFPADFMAQGLKAAGWILGLPALVAPTRGGLGPGTIPGEVPSLGLALVPIYAALGRPWMPVLGLFGLICWMLVIARSSPREALALGALVMVVLMYPGLQFSVRHVFHLEFIWVISVLSIPYAFLNWRGSLRAAPRVLPTIALFLLALLCAYTAASIWQQRVLAQVFNEILAAGRESVSVQRERGPEGTLFLRIRPPPGAQAVIDKGPDSMTDPLTAVPARVGVPNEVRAYGDRLVARLDGPGCPRSHTQLKVVYDARPERWQSLDVVLTLAAGDTVIFPAFYRATQSFAGLQLPASHALCTVAAWRVPMSYAVPMTLTAVLPPDWEDLRLRKGFGSYSTRPTTLD